MSAMPALTPCTTPFSGDDFARLRILEAYIETLKAENESLKRQLAARERCPWWCRRIGPPDDRATGAVQRLHDAEDRRGPLRDIADRQGWLVGETKHRLNRIA